VAKHEYHDDVVPPSTAVGHETTDAEARPVIGFLVVLGVVSIVTAGLMILFYNYLERREANEKSARYPLAAGRARPLPPPPRLQTYPFDDIKELRRAEAPRLERYEWVDKNAGIVRIPIERAIDLTAERGLPYRKEAAAAPSEPNAPSSPETPSGQTSDKGGGH
jgi:hypothetical protein